MILLGCCTSETLLNDDDDMMKTQDEKRVLLNSLANAEIYIGTRGT